MRFHFECMSTSNMAASDKKIILVFLSIGEMDY
jgi:hypothetical protein